MAVLTQVNVAITGHIETGINPGWEASLSSSEPVVVFLTIEAAETLWWAKAEPHPSPLPVSLHVRPTTGSGVQFLYSAGWAWVQSVTANVLSPPPQPPDVRVPPDLPVGQWVRFARAHTEPEAAFGLFLLARADASVGRNRIWRPHKSIASEVPPHLQPALFGSRQGHMPFPRSTGVA